MGSGRKEAVNYFICCWDHGLVSREGAVLICRTAVAHQLTSSCSHPRGENSAFRLGIPGHFGADSGSRPGWVWTVRCGNGIRLWASTNISTTARTFAVPRTRNGLSPRWRAWARVRRPRSPGFRRRSAKRSGQNRPPAKTAQATALAPLQWVGHRRQLIPVGARVDHSHADDDSAGGIVGRNTRLPLVLRWRSRSVWRSLLALVAMRVPGCVLGCDPL